MAPQFRRIKPNHGTETPMCVVTLAVLGEEQLPRKKGQSGVRVLHSVSASAYRFDRGKYRQSQDRGFGDCVGFWRWLEAQLSHRRPVWVFAYDAYEALTLLNFWQLLEDRTFTAGTLILESRPHVVCAKHSRGNVKFVSLLNYYDVTRKELSESIGLGHDDATAGIFKKRAESSWLRGEQVMATEVTWGLLERWREGDCGVFGFSAGRLAMNNWRHSHMAYGVVIDHESPALKPSFDYGAAAQEERPRPLREQECLEGAALHGGWVEAFYRGPVEALDPDPAFWGPSPDAVDGRSVMGPLYALDARGLYPYCMWQHSYPRQLVKHGAGCSVAELRDRCESHGAIARVHVRTASGVYPVRREGRLLMAAGDFWTVLCWPELQRALDNQDIAEVGEYALYSMAPLFKSFVDYWWARRLKAIKSGDVAEEMFTKLIMNSLSGKFAQRSHRWADEPRVACPAPWGAFHAPDPSTGLLVACRAVGWNAQVKQVAGWGRDAFPAITAHIMAWGREYMLGVIRALPEKSVLYIDTDGLLVTQDGLDAMAERGLLAEFRLGGFRLLKQADEGFVYGPRHYRIGDQWCIAGVPAAHGSDGHGTYTYSRPATPGELIATRPEWYLPYVTEEVHLSAELPGASKVNAGWQPRAEVYPCGGSPLG